MVEQQVQALDRVFRALADPTRRGMLRRLSRKSLTVSELAKPCDMSLAAASKHIRVLERAGLVGRQVEGRIHRVRLKAGGLRRAHEWLGFYERFWNARLDALEQVLAQTGKGN